MNRALMESMYGDIARQQYEAWLAGHPWVAGPTGRAVPSRAEDAFMAGFMAGIELAIHDESHGGQHPGCRYCGGTQ